MYVPVCLATKNPCSMIAAWLARKAEWSDKVRYEEPPDQFGVLKVSDLWNPVQSGVRVLKYDEVKPVTAKLASKEWVYFR